MDSNCYCKNWNWFTKKIYDRLYGKIATSFVAIANRYKSEIFVECGNKKVNAKSLLGVLSLSITKGCELSISADGADKKEAVDSLVSFIESGDSYDHDASQD